MFPFLTASVLFYSDLWWLHYLPWNREVHKRPALKVPTLKIWTNWNESLCPANKGTAFKITNFLNSLPYILRSCLSKHLIKFSGVLDLKHTMWKMLQSKFNLNLFQHNLGSNLGGKHFVSYSVITGNKADSANLLDIWIYVPLMHGM